MYIWMLDTILNSILIRLVLVKLRWRNPGYHSGICACFDINFRLIWSIPDTKCSKNYVAELASCKISIQNWFIWQKKKLISKIQIIPRGGEFQESFLVFTEDMITSALSDKPENILKNLLKIEIIGHRSWYPLSPSGRKNCWWCKWRDSKWLISYHLNCSASKSKID